jgi:hypothetical protein
MPLARIELRADIPGLQELRDRLNQEFKPEKRAKFMEDALEKAVQPLFRRLYETTPVGPTENLRRARAYKIVPYPLDGTAVAIVGYKRSARTRSDSALGGRVRSGPDRAFHQWWAEYGTQSRYVGTPANKPYTRKAHRRVMRSGKVVDVSEHEVARQGGYIASSFNQRGPFEFIHSEDATRARRAAGADPAIERILQEEQHAHHHSADASRRLLGSAPSGNSVCPDAEPGRRNPPERAPYQHRGGPFYALDCRHRIR